MVPCQPVAELGTCTVVTKPSNTAGQEIASQHCSVAGHQSGGCSCGSGEARLFKTRDNQRSVSAGCCALPLRLGDLLEDIQY